MRRLLFIILLCWPFCLEAQTDSLYYREVHSLSQFLDEHQPEIEIHPNKSYIPYSKRFHYIPLDSLSKLAVEFFRQKAGCIYPELSNKRIAHNDYHVKYDAHVESVVVIRDTLIPQGILDNKWSNETKFIDNTTPAMPCVLKALQHWENPTWKRYRMLVYEPIFVFDNAFVQLTLIHVRRRKLHGEIWNLCVEFSKEGPVRLIGFRKTTLPKGEVLDEIRILEYSTFPFTN